MKKLFALFLTNHMGESDKLLDEWFYALMLSLICFVLRRSINKSEVVIWNTAFRLRNTKFDLGTIAIQYSCLLLRVRVLLDILAMKGE